RPRARRARCRPRARRARCRPRARRARCPPRAARRRRRPPLAEPLTLSQQPASFEGWTCPLPLRDSPTVVMGHGGGGAMSGELVETVFLPAFADESLETTREYRRLPHL